MSAWGLLGDVLAAVAGGLLLIVLGWAAVERGKVHRRRVQGRRQAARDAAVQVVDWCVTVGTAAGLV